MENVKWVLPSRPYRILQILFDSPWHSNNNNLMTYNTSGVLKSHCPGARLEFDLRLDNENGDDDEVAE